MSLCIPYNVIEPLMDTLASQSWFSNAKVGAAGEVRTRVERSLAHAGLGVTGLMAETTITLNDLHAMSVGDVLTTEKSTAQPIVVCVEGEKKFFARIGQYKGNRALQIIRAVKPGDRV